MMMLDNVRARVLSHALGMLLSAGAILLAGCGGSGGDDPPPPPPEGAPTASISFPPTGVQTDDDEIGVRGLATSEDSTIASVMVGGVEAATTDGFATWTATVSLSNGDNSLVVTVVDVDGLENAGAASVDVRRSDVLLTEPVGVMYDGVLGIALVVDSGLTAIIEVDWNSGARSIFSGRGVGVGPELVSPRGIARSAFFNASLLADRGAQAIFRVEDNGDRSVFSGTPPEPFLPDDVTVGVSLVELYTTEPDSSVVDAVRIANGQRRVLSGDGVGIGPDFVRPLGTTVDAGAFRLLVIDPGANALFGVGFDIGQRTIISDNANGSGPPFIDPVEVTYDGFTFRAYVADPGTARREVTAIQLSNGARSTLSGSSNGTGAAFLRPTDLSFFPGTNTLAVVDRGLDAVLNVNTQSGARTVISEGYWGDGLHIDSARGLVLRGESGDLLVADAGNTRLWRVSLATGERSVISSSTTGSGPEFVSPVDVADVSAAEALVVDEGAGSLLFVNLSNGARSLLSGAGQGSGPAFIDPVAIDLLPGATEATVTDAGAAGFGGAILAVSLSSGDRSEISGPNVGSGPPFIRPIAAVMDDSGQSLLVVDEGANVLYGVNVLTGDRTLISTANDGPGIAGSPFADIAFDAAGNRAIVADPSTHSLLAIVLDTGTRTLLADDASAGGPPFVSPASLVLDAFGNAITTDATRSAIMIADLVTGERVVRSK